MRRLSGVVLSVSDRAKIARFYTDNLGMTARQKGGNIRLGYGEAEIILQPGGGSYEHARTDRYWKIGITLPNLDLACEQLRAAGIAISAPKQFHDIGYMAHLTDPAGFQIELLQHHFQGNRPPGTGDPTLSLGGGARLGQITLRCGDTTAMHDMCSALGLRLLSVQPVPAHGFTLYFWAFTDDSPPDPNLSAPGNREWLWQRPYTTLEFQHIPGLTPTPNPAYAGLEITGLPTVVDAAYAGDIRP